MVTKSIALSSLLATPIALAFTTTYSLHGGAARQASHSTALYSAAAEDNSPRRPPPPSLASPSQEEQLNSNNNLWDVPPSSYPSSQLPNYSSETSLHNSGPEFNLESLPLTPTRRSRLESEARASSIYVPSGSDAYWDLRDEITQLGQDLEYAIDVGVNEESIENIQGMLRRARAKDPEHVYRVTSDAALSAECSGRAEQGDKYRVESVRARKMLPQFNLEGLWVGK